MPKIFKADIMRMSNEKFKSKVKWAEKGTKPGAQKYVELAGYKLKKKVGDMAEGGITKFTMTEKLRRAGLAGSQYEKRGKILKTVFSGEKTWAEKQREVREAKVRMKTNIKMSRVADQLIANEKDPLHQAYAGDDGVKVSYDRLGVTDAEHTTSAAGPIRGGDDSPISANQAHSVAGFAAGGNDATGVAGSAGAGAAPIGGVQNGAVAGIGQKRSVGPADLGKGKLGRVGGVPKGIGGPGGFLSAGLGRLGGLKK